MKKKYLVLIIIVLVAAFLRLYKLDQMPVSLFGDEMDVGYHAYSILKTGRDYYGNFLPFHFHSIAEWRTPLYLYSVVPTVAIFGISALGVRLPAAIFGILGVVAFFYLVKTIREKYLNIQSGYLEYISAFLLAISPWHIQYSRAAFEVTEMILFLTAGLYFFLKAFQNSKYFYLSALFFALMPWVYSTAKLFVPLLGTALVFLSWKELRKAKKKDLFGSLVFFVVLSIPIIYSIAFGGGSQRFGYISVFTDPTIEHEVGVARDVDAWNNSIFSRSFHNKFVVWSGATVDNFIRAYSVDFLFVTGDINLRHSIEDVGLFYKVEFLALLLGTIYFFGSKVDRKIKIFVVFWLVAGVVPAAITRDGGHHATRLILILPPLIFLISYGVLKLLRYPILLVIYCLLLSVFFLHYQHQYWVHNLTYSERWWHYGWKQAVQSIKQVEDNYDKIVISTSDEPPWIFFAASYEYPPAKWQEEFPKQLTSEIKGFGAISHVGKFYFGSPSGDVYEWGKTLDNHTLYLASAKEVGPNLIREPERAPNDLVLLDSIAFPSGEPAFYIFSGKGENEN